jgi:hypothetical protein
MLDSTELYGNKRSLEHHPGWSVKPYLKKQHFVVLRTQAPPLFDCFLDIQSVVANLMIIKDTGAD